MIAWWLAVAFGTEAGPAAFPQTAAVVLPPEGPVRIHLPPALRTADDPIDGTDLMLIDGAGRPVPSVRIGGPLQWETEEPIRSRRLESGRIGLNLGTVPVDALQVTLTGSPVAASMSVQRAGGQIVAESQLVWHVPDSTQDRIRLPPGTTGWIEITVRPHGPTPEAEVSQWTPLRRIGVDLPVDRWSVVPEAGILQENGWVVYALPTAHPLPDARIVVHASDPNVDRHAGIVSAAWNGSFDPFGELEPPTPSPIRRLTLGSVAVEQMAVPMAAGILWPTLAIEAADRPALDISSVDIELDGAQLLVLDAGEGPHRLLGGAPAGTAPTWDLAVATAELLRTSAPVVEPGAVTANPGYVPPEVQANLVAPSQPLETTRFRWSRPVQGPAGLVRIPLPADLLAEAQGSLWDVRLGHQDRKVPHLVRRGAGTPVLDGTLWDRVEDGATSRIRVTLPVEGVSLSSVVLRTSAPLFDRRVVLSVPTADALQPIRAARWIGGDRPGQLALQVNTPVGDTLVIEIDNGDDPPLPIEDVLVTIPSLEIIAVLPEGQTRLYHGDRTASPPDYDLSLLSTMMQSRVMAIATVGAPTPTVKPKLTGTERFMLLFGIGILAAGLLWLLYDLIQRTPALYPSGQTDSPPTP